MPNSVWSRRRTSTSGSANASANAIAFAVAIHNARTPSEGSRTPGSAPRADAVDQPVAEVVEREQEPREGPQPQDHQPELRAAEVAVRVTERVDGGLVLAAEEREPRLVEPDVRMQPRPGFLDRLEVHRRQ